MDKDKKNFFDVKNPNLKHFLIWTGWYFVASYLIFLFIFGFSILNLSDWAKIPRISLHGFGGMAFGAALIAWIPIWLAGLAAISKTGASIFSFAKKNEVPEDSSESEAQQKPEIIYPAGLPEEMHVPYSRLKYGMLSRGAMECHTVQKKPDAALSADCSPAVENELSTSLPDSFDFDTSEESDMPKFREITFGSSEPPLDPQFLSRQPDDIKIETRGNKKFAVATHDDSDFWIADDENWFANGKQKPSPVAAAINAARAAGAAPVLYLASENIMDLDALREKWGEDGVLVIKDLSELN
jgi:hypothetical protein